MHPVAILVQAEHWHLLACCNERYRKQKKLLLLVSLKSHCEKQRCVLPFATATSGIQADLDN